MERSPDDLAMPLRFEPVPVAEFNVLCIWALPWGWFVSLAPPLRHSGAWCAPSGPALENPNVRVLSVCLDWARSRANARRRGAEPNTAQPWSESNCCPNCLGHHSSFLHFGTLFRPLPCIVIVILEGCFSKRVNLIVSLDLLSFLSRSRLVQVLVRSDPPDFYHIRPVRVTVRRQQDTCVHLAGRQLLLEREAPKVGHDFAIDRKAGVTRRHLQSECQACKLPCRAGLTKICWNGLEVSCTK